MNEKINFGLSSAKFIYESSAETRSQGYGTSFHS